MSTVWNKLDPGLCLIYASYCRSRARQRARQCLALLTEDLAGIEALGFETAPRVRPGSPTAR
jgi:hypothetical protein